MRGNPQLAAQLISVSVSLHSIITLFSKSEISSLFSVVVQFSVCRIWSKSYKKGFSRDEAKFLFSSYQENMSV